MIKMIILFYSIEYSHFSSNKFSAIKQKQYLKELLKQCGSGIELIEKGFEQDVELASELDISNCIPTLIPTSDGKAYYQRSRGSIPVLQKDDQ